MINTNKIIDISMDLNEKTVVWPADTQPKLMAIARQPEAECNFTWLDFSAHAGTHIDAPYYLFSDKWTADKIPFDRLIGNCQVLDLTGINDMIEVSAFDKLKITEKIILLKTKNSFDKMLKYNPYHVALSEAAAAFLVSSGVKTIGYDYQSFEREGKNEIHKIFMENNVVCVDNLRLKEAKEGRYYFICLPVKITGIDAAPARALLLKK